MSLRSTDEAELAKLVWCPVDLGLSAVKIQQAATEIANLPPSRWYHCTYRKCGLLLVYGGDVIDERHDLNWLVGADECPTIRAIVDEHVQPLFRRLPRIIVLHTPPKIEMRPHIDCNAREVGTFQPKLRIVLKGQHDDLFFVGEGDRRVQIPSRGASYYMSGAFAHSLENSLDAHRFTLCFGNPWTYDDMTPEFLRRLREGAKVSSIMAADLGNVPHARYAKDVRVEKLITYGTADGPSY